jgi:hypothetical protein
MLTPRQQQVYDVLTSDFQSSSVIGQKADLRTMSNRETAAKFCIILTKLGLAERGGTRTFPLWRKKDI